MSEMVILRCIKETVNSIYCLFCSLKSPYETYFSVDATWRYRIKQVQMYIFFWENFYPGKPFFCLGLFTIRFVKLGLNITLKEWIVIHTKNRSNFYTLKLWNYEKQTHGLSMLNSVSRLSSNPYLTYFLV